MSRIPDYAHVELCGADGKAYWIKPHPVPGGIPTDTMEAPAWFELRVDGVVDPVRFDSMAGSCDAGGRLSVVLSSKDERREFEYVSCVLVMDDEPERVLKGAGGRQLDAGRSGIGNRYRW